MNEDGLFPEPGAPGASAAPGASRRAMAQQIEAWQRAGRAVSLVTRQMLLDQATAVDMARAANRATAISGASKVLLELLVGFRLVDDSPPPVQSDFEKFLAVVAGDDDTAAG